MAEAAASAAVPPVSGGVSRRAVFVEAGPYRFSRNPIYLGLLVAAVGLALRWGDLWGWMAVAASHLMLDRLVVAKEEAYLAARFGPAYEAYRARVRRWI